MGVKYHNAIGVARSYTEAAKWWFKAAKQGHTRSMYEFGDCCKYGLGVEQDQAKASEWSAKALKLARPAAEKGDAESQTVLGLLYYSGNTVPKDVAEAVAQGR
jgi:hypothetical protein